MVVLATLTQVLITLAHVLRNSRDLTASFKNVHVESTVSMAADVWRSALASDATVQKVTMVTDVRIA